MSLAFAVDFDAELLPAIKRSTESEGVAAGSPCSRMRSSQVNAMTGGPQICSGISSPKGLWHQKESGRVLNNQY